VSVQAEFFNLKAKAFAFTHVELAQASLIESSDVNSILIQRGLQGWCAPQKRTALILGVCGASSQYAPHTVFTHPGFHRECESIPKKWQSDKNKYMSILCQTI
jgi:hypothetical protein